MLTSISTIASIIPPVTPGIGGALLTVMQTMVTVSSFSTETNPLTRAQYSKFVQTENSKGSDMIDSRNGMTLIYLPAFLASTALNMLPELADISFLPQQTLAGQFVMIHFLKRVLEVLFLHKYSGKVSQNLSTGIGAYYTIVSVIILLVANPISSVGSLTTNIGTGLFGIGIAGNFYHHSILAGLRGDDTNTDEKKYVAPVGGLFNYVAAPHYLFELMGWLGIAIVANHTNAYLVFTGMTSYLAGRAYSQNEWNRSQFSEKDWPSTRKNMVPFLF